MLLRLAQRAIVMWQPRHHAIRAGTAHGIYMLVSSPCGFGAHQLQHVASLMRTSCVQGIAQGYALPKRRGVGLPARRLRVCVPGRHLRLAAWRPQAKGVPILLLRARAARLHRRRNDWSELHPRLWRELHHAGAPPRQRVHAGGGRRRRVLQVRCSLITSAQVPCQDCR